ncbi:hypothetical protein ACS0TY_002604 [Phlomoides rotata]
MCTSEFTIFCLGSRCRSLGAYCGLLGGMSEGERVPDPDLEEDEVLRVDLEPEEKEEGSTRCLIGKVLINKHFNAFGLLESMKRAMAPVGGFVAREIRKNLFFYQFKSETGLPFAKDLMTHGDGEF